MSEFFNISITTIIASIAAGAGVVGGIIAYKNYSRSARKYEYKRSSSPEMELEPDKPVTIFDIERDGEFLQVYFTVYGPELLIEDKNIFINYISDGTSTRYNLRELTETQEAHMFPIPTSLNYYKYEVVIDRVFPFYNHGKLLLENRSKTRFRTRYNATARHVKANKKK